MPDYVHGYQVALNCLEDRPDAIVCINDYLAMGVLKALKDQNVRVPNDISVVGYDDLLFASILETPLDHRPAANRGYLLKTIEILKKSIERNNDYDAVNLLSPVLKIRESTK